MLRPINVLLVSLVVCARADMEGFIVEGDYANVENHPHSVYLDIDCATDNGRKIAWTCSASILNQRILLTAAHCLYGCSYDSHIGVYLGHEHKDRGKSYSTYSFMVHEEYDPQTNINDICLIKINNPLTLGKKISRVALMRKPPYSEKATIAGWGVVDEISEKQSDMLKYVAQKVLPRYDCLQMFGYLAKGMFCAGAENDEGYASQGDSGAALVVRGYIQIGLVSYKVPTTSRNIVIYTDVGHYYDWIKINSKRIFCI